MAGVELELRRAHAGSEPVAAAHAWLRAMIDGDLRYARELSVGFTREQLDELRRRLPPTDTWGVASAPRPVCPDEEDVLLIPDVDELYAAGDLYVVGPLYVVDEPERVAGGLMIRIRHTGSGPRVSAVAAA